MEEMLHIDEKFQKFIAPSANRKAFIQDYLEKGGLTCPVLRLDGRDHLYVNFPKNQYNPMFRIKTVIAHYDRVEGSAGANDNSAAVYFLMQWALHLSKIQGFHNVRLIFTDGEEDSGGVQKQGAFRLAETFKKLNLYNDDVFVFDACGRGNIPILSQLNFTSLTPDSFIKKYNDLENRTRSLITTACKKGLCLPTAYSDNASFLACGIPAVTITLLPEEEALELMKGQTPKTWKYFHTAEDNLESLTKNAAETMEGILTALEKMIVTAD